jgi:hypothetical protein
MDVTSEQITAYLAQFRLEWVALCVILIILDVAYLGFRTLTHSAREPFGAYLTQRVGILLLLLIIGLVDFLMPNIPLLYMASLFYSGVSVLHIVAQVRAEGVTDIPPSFQRRAEQLRGELTPDDMAPPGPPDKGA